MEKFIMKLLSTSIAALGIVFSSITSVAQNKIDVVPDFGVVQYAGSIGYLSGGLGYDVFESRARLSFHYGEVPEIRGGQLRILSGKFLCVPLVAKLSDRIYVNPIDAGMIVSYHTGENFKSNVPDYFEKNYYWWHTNLRFHVATEHAITFNFHEQNTLKRASLYAEFNLNDLYLVSFFTNTSSLGLHKLVKGGLGIRVGF